MWIDIALSITALLAVIYSLAGHPRSNGKLTKVGIGVIAVATLSLLLSIGKTVNDDREKLDNEKKISLLLTDVKNYNLQAEQAKEASIEASEKAAKLKSAILATFNAIEIENNELIVKLPEQHIRKRKQLFGHVTKQVIVNPNSQAVEDVKVFKNEMDKLEKELIAKVEQIEGLFKKVVE